MVAGWTSLWTGEFIPARQHAEESLIHYDPRKHGVHAVTLGQDPAVTVLACLALSLWSLGYPEQARKKSEEGVALARELSHPFTLAFSLIHDAWLRDLRREPELARQSAETAMSLSNDKGFAFWASSGSLFRGWSLIALGQSPDDGIEEIKQALEAWTRTGARVLRAHFLGLFAEALEKGSKADQALALVEEALRLDDHAAQGPY
jgi:predicted ATPase